MKTTDSINLLQVNFNIFKIFIKTTKNGHSLILVELVFFANFLFLIFFFDFYHHDLLSLFLTYYLN